jgi:hypothetical protein
MDIGDLFDKGGPVIDTLAKKVGVKPEQAKDALGKIAPFVKEKLAGKKKPADKAEAAKLADYADDPSKLSGADADARGQELLDDIDEQEREAKIAEVARSTGLHPDVVRNLMPAATTATVGALDKKGVLKHLTELRDRQAKINLDAADGVMDGKLHGKKIE